MRDINGSSRIRARAIDATQELKLPLQSGPSDVGNKGHIRYRTDVQKVQVHDGSIWKDLGSGDGGGGEPPDYQQLKDTVNQHSDDLSNLIDKTNDMDSDVEDLKAKTADLIDRTDTIESDVEDVKTKTADITIAPDEMGIDTNVNVTGSLDVGGTITSNVTGEDIAHLKTSSSVLRRFTIENNGGGAAMYRVISKMKNGTVNGDWSIGAPRLPGNDGDLCFYNHVTNQYRMLITPSGNAGIGTLSPTARLDVNGDTMLRGDVTTDGEITTTKVNVMNGTTTVPSIANMSYFSGTGNNARVVVDNTSGGNAALRLRSIETDGNVNADFGLAVNSNGTAGIYRYEGATGGSYALLINDTGNVGIGVATPTTRLDVNGDARVRGQLMLDTPSTEGYLYRESSGAITTVAGPDPEPATKRAVFQSVSVGQDRGRTLIGTMDTIPAFIISITGSYEIISDGSPNRTSYSFGYREHATKSGYVQAEVDLITGNVYARIAGEDGFYVPNITYFWVVVEYIEGPGNPYV